MPLRQHSRGNQPQEDPPGTHLAHRNKYERLIASLSATGSGDMKCFGNSMRPMLQSGCLNTYTRQDGYAVGDIVFCKVRGRYIDAHRIIARDPHGRYLIANEHGFQNGWTSTVYGRVVRSAAPDGSVRTF